MTHEDLLSTIRIEAASRLNDQCRKKLFGAKLVYGSGNPGVRGTCFYGSWENYDTLELIEICASGEESAIQLVGTTLHELAHCIAGPDGGHGRAWKTAARSLGLIRAEASGQKYSLNDFDTALASFIAALPELTDGRPSFRRQLDYKSRACPLGHGTRGGKSRGPGSGSRLRLFACACVPPIRVRVARDPNRFRVRCLDCGAEFQPASPRQRDITVKTWP